MKIDHGIFDSVANELIAVIGVRNTFQLIGCLAHPPRRPWRTCLYVPVKIGVNHRISRAIGFAAAEALRLEFGGMILQPGCLGRYVRRHRNIQIRRLHDDGVSVAEISESCDISLRYAQNLVRRGAV